MNIRTLFPLTLAASTIFLLNSVTLADAIGPIKFGHVNAAFNAFTPIGITADLPSAGVAAPRVGGDPSRGRLLPIGFGPIDARFCENDWTMVNINIVSGKEQFTRLEAIEEHNDIQFEFEIDGITYDSARTPLRSATIIDPAGNITRFWWQNDGFFLEPGSLLVGPHWIEATVFIADVSPPEGNVIGSFQFDIVGAAETYCTG